MIKYKNVTVSMNIRQAHVVLAVLSSTVGLGMTNAEQRRLAGVCRSLMEALKTASRSI